jgi:hypothetical protein
MNDYRYEPHILALLEFDGFLKQFMLFCSEYETDEQAFEATERMHARYFGKRKYANWECFRELKNRTLRERKKSEKSTTKL